MSPKPKSKLGSKTQIAENKWRIRVQAGYGINGKPRRPSKTVEGTELDADIAIMKLAKELGVSDWIHAGVTLDMYYHGVFRETESIHGRARTAATLRFYDDQMRLNISPVLGAEDISKITHEQMAACIKASSSPSNTKRCLRAVMRKAYDDGWVAVEPFRRRVSTPTKKKVPYEPWAIPEVLDALRKFQDGDPRLEVFLILGLSGLRKEECLGWRPCDLIVTQTYDIMTGGSTTSELLRIAQAYTEEDGIKETKTDFSARTVPVLDLGRERLRMIVEQSRPDVAGEEPGRARELIENWSQSRFVSMRGDNLYRSWKRALKRYGIRFIPPDCLRHTSETIMQAVGIQDTLVSKLHGHTDLRTDYKHYMRPSTASAERAAKTVGEVMSRGKIA